MDSQNARGLRLRDDSSVSSSGESSSSGEESRSSQGNVGSERSGSDSAESISGGQTRNPRADDPDTRGRVSFAVPLDSAEPSSSKPMRKKKRSAEELVEGVCWLKAKDLDTFRRKYSVPRDVKFRLPSKKERADHPPRGYFTCMLGHFNLALLWFPIPKIVMEFLACYKLCLAQMTVQSIRNIVGLLTRSYEEGHDISLADMMCMLNAQKGRRSLFHQVVPRTGFKLISGAPRKDHDWERYFFFVRLDSCAVEGDLSLVRTQWRIRVKPKNISKTLTDEGLFERLLHRDCSWSSFNFERVSVARIACIDGLESDREPAEVSSSQSSESEMAEMVNLRALRAQKKKEKQPIDLEDRPSASEKDPANEKGSASALVTTLDARAHDAEKTAEERAAAREKRAAATESGAQDLSAKRQKTKNLPVNKPARTGTPIAWFTGIRHEGDHPSDYKEFEHRANVEAAWNYMAKFVMENNHVISAYEGELKARNDAISMLQGQLTAARDATDSEKSSLAQQKKKVKALQASLAERDELILGLNRKVDDAELSKAQAVKDAEAACLEEVQGRFARVSEALKELRKGPMYRLNLKGQTENNMSLVKDLLGNDPPKLPEEMKALEAEMITYGGATEEFEAAFDGVMKLLLRDGSEFVSAENPKGQSSEPARNEPEDGDGGRGEEEEAAQEDGEGPQGENL